MLDVSSANEETMTAKEVAALFGKSITTIYSCPTNRGEIYSKTEILSLYKSGFRAKGDNYD